MNIEASESPGRSLLRQNIKVSTFAYDFHPDAVTAKTISRLSQGVARLTADDAILSESKYIFRRSNSTSDCQTLSSFPNSLRKSRIPNGSKFSTGASVLIGHSSSSCEHSNLNKLYNKEDRPGFVDYRFRAYTKPNCTSSSSALNIIVMTDLSPSFSTIQQSEVSQRNFPQGISLGSKRTFRQVTDSLRGNRLAKFPPVRTKPRFVCPQKPIDQQQVSISTSHGSCNTKQHLYRVNDPQHDGSSTMSSVCSNHKGNEGATSMLASQSSLFSNSNHIYTRKYSSDASMLSITPSHSCSSASSSPVMSSDSDRKYRRSNDARAKHISPEFSSKHRSRRKCFDTVISDSWHWRSSDSVKVRESSLHPRNHRPHIASSNGDDSSDGPICRQKKARFNFVTTAGKAIDGFLESGPFENEKLDNTSRSPCSHRSHYQRRCNCDSTFSRRTNSLSPTKCIRGRRQKPMKFRLSCLRSFESDEVTVFSVSDHTESNFSVIVPRNNKADQNPCTDEDEGDDECSDANPEQAYDMHQLSD